MTIFLLLAALMQPPGLPPVAYLDYQAQPKPKPGQWVNDLCMHAAVCNGLRAIEFQATARDPGDLSLRFLGLSAVEDGWLEHPDDPFGCVGGARLGSTHGSCLWHLCGPDAAAKTQLATNNALEHKAGTFVFCETMADVRACFASGPCAVLVNRNSHAYTIVAVTSDGGCVVADSFPDWSGRSRVAVWTRRYSELLIDGRLPDYEVVAMVGYRE
jgi:hypothetical protein